MATYDSLLLGDHIELLGGPGGVPSADPACPGAIFKLQPGYDLGENQPTVDIVAALLLDGERPFGRRSSNRTITLPLMVVGTSFSNLAAALEVLFHTVDADTWQLTWTRAQGADLNPLPLVFDCFRAGPAQIQWGEVDQVLGNPIAEVTVTCSALPYGRANVPVIAELTTALAGKTAPAAPVTVDGYSAVPGNWLAGQQAGFDGSLGGWTALSNCSVATSAAQSHTAPMSMAMTSAAAGDMTAAGPPGTAGLPVVAGQVVTVTGWFRAAVSGRAVSVDVRWYNPAGVYQSTSTPLTGTDVTGSWTQFVYNDIYTAPAAGYAVPVAHIYATGAGSEVHYVDDVVIGYDWHQSMVGPGTYSAHWEPSLYGNPTGAGLPAAYAASFLPVNLMQGWTGIVQAASLSDGYAQLTAAAAASVSVGHQFQLAYNFLTGQNAGFEGGIGNWVTASNSTVAESSAQAHTGSDSMSVTSVAAGNMWAKHCSAGNVLADGMSSVSPGSICFASAWFLSAVSARACQVGFLFYDAGGNALLSGTVQYPGSTVTDGTGAWVQATATMPAPAQAEYGVLVVEVQGTGAASEVHYVDDVVLATPAAPVYAVSSVQAPFFGTSNVFYSPNAPSAPQPGTVMIQTGPLPNLGALTLYCGLGSTAYYRHWCQKGGPVRFAMTLTDNAGNQCSFSKVRQLKGSRDSGNPKWYPIRMTIPGTFGFNWTAVVQYQLTVTNRETTPGGVQGPDMAYTDVYLAQMTGAPLTVPKGTPSRGVVYDLAGMAGTARTNASWQFQQAGAPVMETKTFAVPSGAVNLGFDISWTAPAGVTSVTVSMFGGGGGGTLSAGAGGGGEYASQVIGVTPGLTYTGVAGAAGGAEPSTGQPGAAGGASSFTGDSVTVTAHGGAGGLTAGTGGAGGSGSTNTTHYNGGTGGTYSGSGGGGPGGGSSAGTGGAGNAGSANSGASGGAGGTAPAGGFAGGAGAADGARGGTPANGTGYGAGGGCAGLGSGGSGGNGAGGWVQLSYLSPPAFKTLIAHRPSFYAPDTLCPFVSPSPQDIPNGATQYPVPTLIPGLNARFADETTGLTYSVVLVNSSWDTPANSRNLTVTVYTYEQAGGNSSSVSIGPIAVIPNNLTSAFVILGELTLPAKLIPPDNQNAYHTVSITSSDTSDRFLDVLFLDTQGSTVIIQTYNNYVNFFVDEPDINADLGVVSGSMFDRADAISVLDATFVSGAPLGLDPYGCQSLLAYAVEGAPAGEITYYPRFFAERTV